MIMIYESSNQEEWISFDQFKLASSLEARQSPISLDIVMTFVGMDKCIAKRVIVDTGASIDVLLYKGFQEIGLDDKQNKSNQMESDLKFSPLTKF